MMSSVHFDQPVFLWLIPFSLLVLAIIIYLPLVSISDFSAIYQSQRHNYYRHPLITLAIEAQTEDNQERKLNRFNKVLRYAIVLILMHLSLAQPYLTGNKLSDPPMYRDIIFIIDTSVSMNIRDYQISGKHVDRMSMVKKVLDNFIEGLPDSRMGLVVFSEKAYLYVPLTSDHNLLTTQLYRLKAASLTGRRTIVGHALLYTLDTLDVSLQTGRTPVMVLLTDANQPFGDIDPVVAAKLIEQRGVKLHTIAMGSANTTSDISSGSSGLYQPVDFRLLEEIAANGGGQFFHANKHVDLEHALAAIKESEKQEILVEPQYRRIPLYHWPLVLALSIILAWQTLALRSTVTK